MALARLFTEAGYTAKTFHSADPVIYNRGSIHKNLGYGPYYYHDNLGMDDYMLDTQLMRGFGYMTADQPFSTLFLRSRVTDPIRRRWPISPTPISPLRRPR